MSYVTLTFEVWIRVKVTAHRLNEDNICTKLDGNAYDVIAWTRKVMEGQTDGQTDGLHFYNPPPHSVAGD